MTQGLPATSGASCSQVASKTPHCIVQPQNRPTHWIAHGECFAHSDGTSASGGYLKGWVAAILQAASYCTFGFCIGQDTLQLSSYGFLLCNERDHLAVKHPGRRGSLRAQSRKQKLLRLGNEGD